MKNPVQPLACILAGITGFVLMSVVEFALVARSTPLFEAGAGAGLTTLAFMIGLDGVAGLAFGLALALVLPSLVGTLKPGAWLRGHVLPGKSGDTPGARLNGATAWMVGGLVGVLVLAAVAGVAGRVAHGFNNGALALPFVALGAILGCAFGLLAMFPARALTGALLGKLARNGRLGGLPTPALVFAGLGLIGLLVLWRIAGLDLGAYKLGGLIMLAVAMAVSLLLVAVWRQRAPVRPGIAGAILALMVAGLNTWAVVGLGDAPVASRIIPLHGHVSRLMVSSLRRALDFDGDGFAELLGGGDCDDGDPKIGPHAKEIPGNGIDENCRGGDAPIEDVADPPAPEPKAPASAGVASAPPPKPKPKLNVLFILIDTLRPDHMGLYGYGRPTSPVIDAWAKDAVVFEQAYAQAPNTPRSTPSILTGRYPSRIKWTKRFANYGALEPENETLFELFSAAGWHTEVRSAHWYFERAEGIKAGVDNWDNSGFTTIKKSNTQTMAHVLTPSTISRLEALSKGEKPFVMMVHYFEPHGRYMNQKSAKVFGKKLMDKYDSEISYVDKHLEPLFAALERLDRYKDTVVVLTSDHGEAFKEHGFYFHGRTVYTEELKVPLIIRAPGAKPRRVKDFVGLVDLVPTLADLVGLKASKAQGQSLAPLLDGSGTLGDRVVFLEQLPYPNYKVHIVGGIDSNGIKAIRNITDNVTEVFDLKTDPFEKINLLDRDPQAGEAVRAKLDRFIDADPG